MAYGLNGRSRVRPSHIGARRGASLSLRGYPSLDTGPDLEWHNPDGSAKYGQIDLNRGLTCFVDHRRDGGNFTRCISSENYDGRIRSWSELLSEMDWAETISGGNSPMSRRSVWYHNPAWHFVGNVWDGGNWKFASDFKPDSVASVWIGIIGNSLGRELTEAEKQEIRADVAAGTTPQLDGKTPERVDQGAKVYIVDPKTGIRYEMPSEESLDPDAPFFPDGSSIHDAIYGPVSDRAPGQPGYTPPLPPASPPVTTTTNGGDTNVIHDDDLDDYTPIPGGGGGGAPPPPAAPPPIYTPPPSSGQPPVYGPPAAPPPTTQVTPAPAPSSGMGKLALIALGVFALSRLK